MDNFKVYAYTDQDLRATANYHESYKVLCKQKERFQCDLFLRFGMLKTTQVFDLVDESQSLIVEQKKQVGERAIEVHNLEQQLVGYIIGDSILDTEKQLIAKVVDPAGVGKKILKNMAGLDPDCFYIEDGEGARIAEFKRPAGPKGNSLVKLIKVICAGLTSKDTEIYQLSVKSWPLSGAWLMMLVILKYQERNRGV